MKTIAGRIILITGLVASIFLFANRILAKDVPLPTKKIIDNAIDGPQYIVSADIDQDGVLDLVGAATDSNEIAWWKNTNGDGTIWTKTTIDASFTNAEEVSVADIDHDGDLDVLGAAPDAGSLGEIVWWENLGGTGNSWTKHVVADFPTAMSVHSADIDNDGDVDVVGANYNGSDIYWWENSDGGGLTWTSHMISDTSSGARSVKTADVDDDGDLDVLSVALLDDDISWWENIGGDGTSWTEHRLSDTFDGASAIQAGDLDGDGDLDILGGAQIDDRIVWWENNRSDPATWVEHTITNSFVGVRSVFSVDLDRDGDMDVVGAAFESNTVTWWENVAGDASTWTEHVLDNNFGNAISVTVTDIDSDGDPDVVAAAELDDTIAWWENETIHGKAVYPSEFTHIISDSVDGSVWSEAVDMDEDGDLDVIAAGYNEGSISWFENTDGNALAWNQHIVSQITDIDHWPYMIHSADIDRDGDLDLASVAIADNELAWYENVDGTATSWVTHTVGSTGGTARHLAIADVDGDGDDDLLTTCNCSSTFYSLRWWENLDNGANWEVHFVPVFFPGNRPVNTADVDTLVFPDFD